MSAQNISVRGQELLRGKNGESERVNVLLQLCCLLCCVFAGITGECLWEILVVECLAGLCLTI